MDFNLTAFSTEHLKSLLEAKMKKEQTPIMVQTIEAIRGELAAREGKAL